jgi:hypothetical protein
LIVAVQLSGTDDHVVMRVSVRQSMGEPYDWVVWDHLRRAEAWEVCECGVAAEWVTTEDPAAAPLCGDCLNEAVNAAAWLRAGGGGDAA